MIFKVSSLVADRSGETVKDGADDGEASSALFVFCAKRGVDELGCDPRRATAIRNCM